MSVDPGTRFAGPGRFLWLIRASSRRPSGAEEAHPPYVEGPQRWIRRAFVVCRPLRGRARHEARQTRSTGPASRSDQREGSDHSGAPLIPQRLERNQVSTLNPCPSCALERIGQNRRVLPRAVNWGISG
jgi:hypothetical protein